MRSVTALGRIEQADRGTPSSTRSGTCFFADEAVAGAAGVGSSSASGHPRSGQGGRAGDRGHQRRPWQDGSLKQPLFPTASTVLWSLRKPPAASSTGSKTFRCSSRASSRNCSRREKGASPSDRLAERDAPADGAQAAPATFASSKTSSNGRSRSVAADAVSMWTRTCPPTSVAQEAAPTLTQGLPESGVDLPALSSASSAI